ncbi:MAG: OstA-like protein [Alloprevotella sp.]
MKPCNIHALPANLPRLRGKGGLVVCLLLLCSTLCSLAEHRKPRKKNEEKIHLVHADLLSSDQFANPGAQTFSGNVAFLHAGMKLTCDSAVLYQASNSFEAFGHVRMTQGDTLSLTGDRLFYDGETLIAEVRHNVVMTHRKQVLKTDSLNYDRLYNVGYYFDGGELIDGKNVLTSDWGEYHTDTRLSTFNYNVELKNPKFRLVSDTLHYDTRTKWAELAGRSNIYSGQNRIYTERGFYNTETERARLYDKTELHNGPRHMRGDSILYDKKSGWTRAYRNIFYQDKENKQILTGHYGQYNELTGEAMATDSALAKDYSSAEDTLFVHGDTLRLYTYYMHTDSVFRKLHGYLHVRAYRRDVQAVADSLVFNSQLRRMTLYRDPIIWNENRQIVGEEINVFLNDSTIDSIYVDRQALLAERIDSLKYNQVSGGRMRSYYENGEMRLNCVDENVRSVYYPIEKDSLILQQNYMETPKMRMYMQDRKMAKLWGAAGTADLYPIGTAPKERTYLNGFTWFDYIRPLSKHDLFEWRPKRKGSELKPSFRKQAPLQHLSIQ